MHGLIHDERDFKWKSVQLGSCRGLIDVVTFKVSLILDKVCSSYVFLNLEDKTVLSGKWILELIL